MSNSPRDIIKKNLIQCVTHIETIQQYLVRNGEMNSELHPEITEQYKIIYAYFEEGKNIILTIRATY